MGIKKKVQITSTTIMMIIAALSAVFVIMPNDDIIVRGDPVTDWDYFKVCNIGDAANDYQIRINVTYSSGGDVDCESHCQADFDDVRFYDIDNTTELDYFLEAKSNSNYAIMWVELPADAASDDKIIMYYGNTTKTSDSNGAATFPLFEDWSSDHTGEYDGIYREPEEGYKDNVYYRTLNSSISEPYRNIMRFDAYYVSENDYVGRAGFGAATENTSLYGGPGSTVVVGIPDRNSGVGCNGGLPFQVRIRDTANSSINKTGIHNITNTSGTLGNWHIIDSLVHGTTFNNTIWWSNGTYVNSTEFTDNSLASSISYAWYTIKSGDDGAAVVRYFNHSAVNNSLNLGITRNEGKGVIMHIRYRMIAIGATTRCSWSSFGSETATGEPAEEEASTYSINTGGLVGSYNNITFNISAGESTAWSNGSAGWADGDMLNITTHVNASDNCTDIFIVLNNQSYSGNWIDVTEINATISVDDLNGFDGEGIAFGGDGNISLDTNWASLSNDANPFPMDGAGWTNHTFYVRYYLSTSQSTAGVYVNVSACTVIWEVKQ